MTEYVILRKIPGSDEWEQFPETVEASSARRALTASQVAAGEYVAVPFRSWQPLTVKSETVTKITIG